MGNKKVQVIYDYLVNYISDKEIKDLIMYLQDYAYNGSMLDNEIPEELLQKIKEVLDEVSL